MDLFYLCIQYANKFLRKLSIVHIFDIFWTHFQWNYAIAFITFSPGKRHNFVTVFEKYGNGCECVSASYKINAIVYRNTLDTDKEKEKEESK